MKQFVLIDQSLSDYGGHHYEYAQRVLLAAREAGYEPLLAANRKCRDAAPETSEVFPVYQHGYWYRFEKPRLWRMCDGAVNRAQTWAFRCLLSALFSPAGLTWVNRHELGDYWRRAWSLAQPRERAYLLPLLVAMAAFKLLGRGTKAVLRLAMAVLPFRAWIIECSRACRGFCRGVCASIWRLLRFPMPLRYLLANCRKTRCFERDTRQLLDQLTITADDIFFIPNIDENEMAGLLRILRDHPTAALASWHLLFRRNIYTGRPSQYLKQDEGQRQLRNQFRSFQQQTENARVFFYTDTRQLSEQYDRLGVGTFTPLPVPIGADYLPEERGAVDYDCPNIVYLGDAREEKGYQYLPALVQNLWPDFISQGRARCTFQSNYNTRSGEAPAVVARHQLAGYPAEKVRLLLEPLAPVDYRDLILGADIAVLPYDRDNYYARSSGVFSESIAAGVPVVVPAGSWMAIQLAGAVEDYHDRLLRSQEIQRETVFGKGRAWRSLGRNDKFMLRDGALQLGGRASHYCSMKVPEGANYLLVRMRQECDHPGEFVRIELQSRIPHSPDYRSCRACVAGGVAHDWATALLEVPSDARIRVVFRCAFDQYAQTLSGVEFHFLRSPVPLPLSAAGVTYDAPQQLSQAVCEILNHLRHYSRTAAELSATWSAYNHPDTIVAALTAQAQGERTSEPDVIPLRSVDFANSIGWRKAS